MKLTGTDIRKQEFPRKLRGYDPLDVNAFLQFVADAMDQVNASNEDLSDKCVELSRQVDQMRGREARIDSSLRAVSELREEAKIRSETLLEDARSDAERTLRQAGEEASRITQEAEWNSRRLKDEVAVLEKLREKTVQNLAEVLRVQTRLLENEADRLGIDIPIISVDESGKVVPIKQKAEGESS